MGGPGRGRSSPAESPVGGAPVGSGPEGRSGSVPLEEDLAADHGEVHARAEDLVVGAGEDVP